MPRCKFSLALLGKNLGTVIGVRIKSAVNERDRYGTDGGGMVVFLIGFRIAMWAIMIIFANAMAMRRDYCPVT